MSRSWPQCHGPSSRVSSLFCRAVRWTRRLSHDRSWCTWSLQLIRSSSGRARSLSEGHPCDCLPASPPLLSVGLHQSCIVSVSTHEAPSLTLTFAFFALSSACWSYAINLVSHPFPSAWCGLQFCSTSARAWSLSRSPSRFECYEHRALDWARARSLSTTHRLAWLAWRDLRLSLH